LARANKRGRPEPVNVAIFWDELRLAEKNDSGPGIAGSPRNLFE